MVGRGKLQNTSRDEISFYGSRGGHWTSYWSGTEFVTSTELKPMVSEKLNTLLNWNLKEISPACLRGEDDRGCNEHWGPTTGHDKYVNEDQTVVCYKVHAESWWPLQFS